MKPKKNKASAIDQFRSGLGIALEEYYRQCRSDNAKRAWEKRRQLSTAKTWNVKQCKV